MADGSSAELIIDNREGGLFRVNRRSFTDPQILELERMNHENSLASDELQMQMFWRRWNEMVSPSRSGRAAARRAA